MADKTTQASQDNVTLVVNGKEYGGWKSVRITAGIERQARDFDLDVTDTWPGNNNIARRVQPGDICECWIGADKVLTGYIDATPISYTGKAFTVGVKGRSKTADLVDCAAINTPGQWRGRKLEAIAADLAATYGVKVLTETDTGAVIADHQIQAGESVFESIDRMMRLRYVLSTDNAHGDLVFIEIGSAGRAGTALELGVNIESGSAGLDYKDVYSQYICKGQRSGNDDQFGDAVAATEEETDDTSLDSADGGSPGGSVEVSASISNRLINRKRVLVIKQSGQADGGTCKDRVNYEQAHRAAKALQAEYVVNGWRQQDGKLWLPNQLVRVRDGLIGLDVDMVIAEVSWMLDKDGQRVQITVGPPEGYVTQAAKQKKRKKSGAAGANWSDVK